MSSPETAASPPPPGATIANDLYFCPDGHAATLMRRRDIPRETMRAIQALHEPRLVWNLVIPLHFGLWLGAAALAIRSPWLALDLACFAVAGLALSTLSVITHEAAHNLCTGRARLDRWIALLAGLPLGLTGYGYRITHPIHHVKLRTPDDPDDIENLAPSGPLLTLAYLGLFFIGSYLYLFHVPITAWRRGTWRQRAELAAECAAIVGVFVAAWTLLPVAWMLQGWLFPMLVAVQVANIRGIAEHGLTSKGNEFIDARTVVTYPWLNFLICNINFHIEHHLFQSVPWYNLPKVHALLAEEYRATGASVYRGYRPFLRDVFVTLFRTGATANRRLIPSRLRGEICF